LRYIWLETGLDLPVNLFVEAPTIRQMAIRLYENTAGEAQALLRLGGNGDKPILFFFPGGAGFLHELTDIARAFDVPGAIYGVTASGTDGRDPIHDNIYDEAARAACLIQKTQDRGPYNIAGYSLGGCLALETARILQMAGQGVQLMMLDTGLNEHCWPLAIWAQYMLEQFLIRVRGRLKRRSVVHQDVDEQEMPTTVPARRGTMFEFRFRNPRHSAYPYFSPYWQTFHPPIYTKMRARAIIMKGLYTPKPYPWPLVFFLSRGGDPASCNPRKLWQKYLPNAEWLTVSGNHTSMIMGRHAKHLAVEMSKRLKLH
jgi:thioesterase domain-containing protein